MIWAAWLSFSSLLLMGRECWEKSLTLLWAVATNPIIPCSIMSVTAASLLDQISRIRRAFLFKFWLKSWLVFLVVIVDSWGWSSILLWREVSLGTQSLLLSFTFVFSLLSTSGGVDGGVESGGTTTSDFSDVSSLSVCRVSAVLVRSESPGCAGPRPPVTPGLAPPEPRNKARWTAAAAASGKGG